MSDVGRYEAMEGELLAALETLKGTGLLAAVKPHEALEDLLAHTANTQGARSPVAGVHPGEKVSPEGGNERTLTGKWVTEIVPWEISFVVRNQRAKEEGRLAVYRLLESARDLVNGMTSSQPGGNRYRHAGDSFPMVGDADLSVGIAHFTLKTHFGS